MVERKRCAQVPSGGTPILEQQGLRGVQIRARVKGAVDIESESREIRAVDLGGS